MHSTFSRALLLLVASLPVACGGSGTTDKPSTSGTAKKAAPKADDEGQVAAADEWQTIITGDWTLDPGTESYTCVRKTVDEDLVISAFDAIIPLGTHHTLLTVGDPNADDGITPCTAADNFPLSIFGSGVGTNSLEMPAGVAVKVEKGKQLLLNLHLFNTGTDPLSGTSGTRVKVMDPAQVENYAEGILAGTVNLDLPPHQTTVSTGYCAMSHDVTLFAVAPHMHQHATKFDSNIQAASGNAYC